MPKYVFIESIGVRTTVSALNPGYRHFFEDNAINIQLSS